MAGALAALGTIGALVWLSLWLAGTRIYQVDECQNVYVAQLLSSGRGQSSFTAVTLYLAPLVWLGRGVGSSVELFATARYFALAVFWLNVLLLAIGTGERLLSRRGVAAFVGAATLAPLWDYGFEIRHDNLLLTGLLMLWCGLRVFPRGVRSYMAAGALAVILQFIAFKAFVYTLPLCAVSLLWPAPMHRISRTRGTVAWLTGAVAMFFAIRAGYSVAGWWSFYLRDFVGVSATAVGAVRFSPLMAFARLCRETPLLIGAVGVAVIYLREDVRRYGVPALRWDSLLPETLLLLVSLVALFVNPTPYPYNLVNVAPFAFLLAFRLLSTLSTRFASHTALPAVWVFASVAHLGPFVAETQRHIHMSNGRQKALMQVSEDLTDPATDPVYDGIGMVPTRRSIGYHWLLHSLYVNRFEGGDDLRLRDMLAERPAAVIIPSYRTDWLPPADHEFIRSRYVPLSDDFWVLGGLLPPGGGSARIVHAGRYRILALEERNGSAESVRQALRRDVDPRDSRPRPEVAVDGKIVADRVFGLPVGTHQITCLHGCRPAFLWVGPRLADVPLIDEGDHQSLFVNWY